MFQSCSETYGTFFGHPDSAIKSIVDNLQKLGCDHEVLSGQEANDRYKFFQLPKEYVCAVDKSAGILPASKTVHVLQVRYVMKSVILTHMICIITTLSNIHRPDTLVKLIKNKQPRNVDTVDVDVDTQNGKIISINGENLDLGLDLGTNIVEGINNLYLIAGIVGFVNVLILWQFWLRIKRKQQINY